MEKAQQLIEYRIDNSNRLIPPTVSQENFSPAENQQWKKTPDDETEPKNTIIHKFDAFF